MPRVPEAVQEGMSRVPKTGAALPCASIAAAAAAAAIARCRALLQLCRRPLFPAAVEAYLTATNVDALEAEGELLPHEAQALEALRAAAAAAAPPVLSGTDLYLQLAASKLLSTVSHSVVMLL